MPDVGVIRTLLAPRKTLFGVGAVDKVGAEMSKAGVICNTWISHFVIAPPLIINKEQLDSGIDAMDEGLKVADKEVEA